MSASQSDLGSMNQDLDCSHATLQHFRDSVRSAKLMPEDDEIKEYLAKCGGPPARSPPTPRGKPKYEVSLSEDDEENPEVCFH